ncbi:MAG TPA: DUF2339 domain-containing protein [Candidatus Limnocylindrales bacterium]|nr:DUF2339 domain-containing protein [Candidatus Limnocylindrales bacterium]
MKLTTKIIGYGLACLGTATIASLVRFEAAPEYVSAGYSAIVLALLATSWRTRHEIFTYQALAMLGVTAFRISLYNFYSMDKPAGSAWTSSLWAIGLLAAAVPFGFLLRKSASTPASDQWFLKLSEHMEQPLFFVPVVLMAILLLLKTPDLVTLAWGAEGVLVFLLALVARERSFRLTGLSLIMLCVGKVVVWDVWHYADARARYLTLIGIGLILLVISFLYGRYREAFRELL